jgi:hypothetical protein
VRLGRRAKQLQLCWLASSEGPRPSPFLHRLRLGLCARLRLANRDFKHNRVLGFARYRTIYVLSPPDIKVRAIKRYARDYRLDCFIETGTFLGATTAAMASAVRRCITIELSPELHAQATARFAGSNVTCIHGDSGTYLAAVMRDLREPALFWLDAHASGGITTHAGYNPLAKELATIFAHDIAGHVVLVDDVRGHDLAAIAARVPATHEMRVRNDIARITPRRG